jgi:acetyltransferase-like isoleucine patch superfamily enzyme
MEKFDGINKIRGEIKSFYSSSEMLYEFIVSCELKDRIPFIYNAILPGARKYLFYFHFFLSRLAYYIDYSPLKVLIYRSMGVKIGKRVFISPKVYIDVHFPKLIRIEDDVILGVGTYLFVHDFINQKYRMGRVHIKQGAVVGAFAKISCGVCIGREANLRANSIVVRDVPDFKKHISN